MNQEPPHRRRSDSPQNSSSLLIGILLVCAAVVAAAAIIGVVIIGPNSRALMTYVAIASSVVVFVLAGLYAVRSERGSSETWRNRLGGGRTEPLRDWVHGTLAFDDFVQELRREIARSRRSGRPCSILQVEPSAVGGFENETVRMFTLDRIASSFRATDLMGHAPGALALLVMLPETDGDGAGIAAGRLRRQAEDFRMRRGDGTAAQITVNVVAATYPDDETDVDNLLERVGVSPAPATRR